MAGDEGNRWPREKEARDYIEKHKILELFNNLTSELIYERPDEPKKHLVDILEKLIKARTTSIEFPCLFDDSNIESVFGMLDPTNRGYITLAQYKEALQTFGVSEFDEHPPGGDVNKVTLDTFTKEAKSGLSKTSATFAKKTK